MKAHKTRGGELLDPILKAKLAKKNNNEKLHINESEDEQDTFISWILRDTGERIVMIPPCMYILRAPLSHLVSYE